MKLSHLAALICSTKRRDPVGRKYASYWKSSGFEPHSEKPVFQTDVIRDFQHLLQANSGKVLIQVTPKKRELLKNLTKNEEIQKKYIYIDRN